MSCIVSEVKKEDLCLVEEGNNDKFFLSVDFCWFLNWSPPVIIIIYNTWNVTTIMYLHCWKIPKNCLILKITRLQFWFSPFLSPLRGLGEACGASSLRSLSSKWDIFSRFQTLWNIIIRFWNWNARHFWESNSASQTLKIRLKT